MRKSLSALGALAAVGIASMGAAVGNLAIGNGAKVSFNGREIGSTLSTTSGAANRRRRSENTYGCGGTKLHNLGKTVYAPSGSATERKRERQRVAKMSNVPDGKSAGHKMLDAMARAKSLHERQKWRDARYEQRVHAGVQF